MSDRYEKWREKAEKHDLNHTTVKRNGQKDFSCIKCHQPSEIMRKEFKRFWKWYKEEIPEVRSYSAKTEENFEELMKEDFSVKECTGTEKAKIRYRLIWLIESMRYDKSPEKMTKEIIETVIEEKNKIKKKLWEEKEETTLLEELKNNTEETYNKKGKGRETYEEKITEFEDPVENIINMGDFGIPKTSDLDLDSDLDSEKDSEKEFGESEEESQELESEEVENYSESESEEELVIVNPLVNMALNIIQVENFDGENVDAERWLKKLTRAATANNWVGDARVGNVAAKMDG